MLLPLDTTRNIITIVEGGFSAFRKKTVTTLLLSFLGVACLAAYVLVKTQFSLDTPFNWLVPITSLSLSQIFFGGLIYFLYTTNKNLPCSLKRAILVGFEKLPGLIITLFIYCLIVFIGTVAFVIPGLFLSILCLFGFILIYTDNYDPILALTSSFKFCKNQLILVSIILFMLGLFISLSNLLGLAFGYLLFITFMLNPAQLFLTNLLIVSIINTILIPIAYSVMISLLHDLKIKQTQV